METTPPTADPESGTGPVGGVRRDAQGNAVWEWASQALESTSRLLRKLEVPGLKLLDDPADAAPPDEARPKPGPVTKEQSFDPYQKAIAPRVTPRPARPVQAPVSRAKPVRTPGFLSRLLRRR
jgi:hypothetical protein